MEGHLVTVRKKPYAEGDALLIPLRAGFGVAVTARAARGIIWGYLFLFERRPMDADLAALRPEAAVYKTRLGDLDVLRGRWEVLGQLPGWNRALWPMLVLRRDHAAVVYDPDDPSKEIVSQMRPISAEEAQGMPEDGLAGGGYVEAILQRLLDARHQAAPAA